MYGKLLEEIRTVKSPIRGNNYQLGYCRYAEGLVRIHKMLNASGVDGTDPLQYREKPIEFLQYRTPVNETTGPSDHYCYICYEEFNFRYRLERHELGKDHREKKKNRRKRRKNRNREEDEFPCYSCDFTFSSEFDMGVHYGKLHSS